MKKLFVLSLLSIVFMVQSCDKDCSGYDCFTPPSPFVFEILDKTTGVNLIENGTFTEGNFKVYDIENNNNREFSVFSKPDYNVLMINSIGWRTEDAKLIVKINEKDIFSLNVSAESISENCCSFTEYKNIEIGIAEYERHNQSLNFKIFID